MSAGVLALVIAAAFAHAGWNFLAKGAEGGAAFVWLARSAGTVLWLPVLAIALAVFPGELGWVALGLMVGSGVLHALYFTLLQRGYATGDLSLVYPLARGTGPLLVDDRRRSRSSGSARAGSRSPGALMIVVAVFSLARAPRSSARGDHRSRSPPASRSPPTRCGTSTRSGPRLSPIVYYWGTNLANALVVGAVGRRAGRRRCARAWTLEAPGGSASRC